MIPKSVTVLMLLVLSLLMAATGCTTHTAEAPESVFAGSMTGMAIGNGTMFAIQPCGALWTWGMMVGHRYAQNAPFNHVRPMEQVQISGAVVYVSTAGMGNMSEARNHAMAITSDGALWGWGDNGYGQLGDGTYTRRSQPVWIKDNIVAVATGPLNTMAIDAEGILWGWGDNTFGQLATCHSDHVLSNQPIKIMGDVVSVSVGFGHILAMRTDGSLWGWGNRTGLGIGRVLNPDNDLAALGHPQPTEIMEDVISIATGSAHSLAITSDGTLWAWGSNGEGQLGNGTDEMSPYPTRIKEGVVAIAAAFWHSAAITQDGGLYTWGSNSSGQLGTGDADGRFSPERVMDGVIQVSTGRLNTMAARYNGDVMGWGSNVFGQIARGGASRFYAPVGVLEDVTFTKISADRS